MLSIKRETDYAVRCVLYLSGKGDAVTMVDEIAREMEIPRSFLAKILQKLSREKIVNSFVGVKGGFSLARDPALISLYDVIAAIEGPLAVNRCTAEPRSCSRQSGCSVHPVFISVREELERLLKARTFDKLQ
jgi:Rrf2 family protein